MNSIMHNKEDTIMKLGFVSAILDGWTFEEMIDTASEMGYSCVEVAC